MLLALRLLKSTSTDKYHYLYTVTQDNQSPARSQLSRKPLNYSAMSLKSHIDNVATNTMPSVEPRKEFRRLL
ncbi:hypothetical protein FIU95_12940 [Microbulbifer sp. THAF38]|nr:hypothetical protein FIU95_12940 [Microbulbifer sp. THAF38]